MELAALIGITNEEFWEIEPYELSIYVKAFQKSKELNIKTQRNLLTMQAYQIAGWVWKRPSETELEKLLNFETEEDKKEMTASEMLNQVKMLNQMFGGEIKYGTT
jgi:hypothetical protein